METKMQTSFIPKKPIVESRSEGTGISLFLLLSIIVFIVSVAMCGGVWIWQKSLVGQIEKDKADLESARATYEEDAINNLIRLDNRISVSNDLLEQHLAISPVFVLLEQKVLKNVQLKTMKFSFGTGNQIKIDLTGNARNYDALLKQADALGKPDVKDYLYQPVVSDFNPTENGTIAFSFTALLTPKLVSYPVKISTQ
ncbi:MAG: hypothetical protein WC027_02825 [Candidatus Paceibacterota bacterium]